MMMMMMIPNLRRCDARYPSGFKGRIERKFVTCNGFKIHKSP